MKPFSRSVPKELVPLGSVPALHLVVREAVEAGLTEIALVLRPGKEILLESLEELRKGWSTGFELLPILQERPTGLADALSLCREFVAGESFALLLPDNVLPAREHELSRMITLHQREGLPVSGVLELSPEHSGLYGNSGRFRGEEIEEGIWQIDRLEPKGRGRLEIPPGGTVRRTCGRSVLTPDLFDRIERVRPTVHGECSEVPVFRELAREGRLLGLRLESPLFDVGHPRGVAAAGAWLAADPRRLERLLEIFG